MQYFFSIVTFSGSLSKVLIDIFIIYAIYFFSLKKTLKGSRFQVSNYRFVFLSLSNLQKNKHILIKSIFIIPCICLTIIYVTFSKNYSLTPTKKDIEITFRMNGHPSEIMVKILKGGSIGSLIGMPCPSHGLNGV